jgi:hypothetical protein
MITITLNADSQLFLTEQEATQLAIDLQDQLQTANQIIIADTLLTAGEGWRVLRSISDAVAVDWKIEGF